VGAAHIALRVTERAGTNARARGQSAREQRDVAHNTELNQVISKRLIKSVLALVPFFALVASLNACTSLNPLDGGDARCDLRPKMGQCTDWRGLTGPEKPTIKMTCSTLTTAKGGGEYSDEGACDTKGSLGGCQADNPSGSQQTNWYYPGGDVKTADDVKKKCESGQHYVPGA
jgi:hypothetical protein